MKYPNIEAERVRHRMTRSAAARYLGVKKDVYLAWVKGEYPIPANFIYRLCDLFRCSADYLLAGDSRGYKWRMYRRI